MKSVPCRLRESGAFKTICKLIISHTAAVSKLNARNGLTKKRLFDTVSLTSTNTDVAWNVSVLTARFVVKAPVRGAIHKIVAFDC